MTSILTADRWIYQTLTNDSTLTGLGVTAIYSDIAPATAATPFVIINGESAIDYRQMGPNPLMYTESWIVRVVITGESYSTAEPILNRIRALLNVSTPVVMTSGSMSGTMAGCIERDQIRYPEIYDGKQYRHLGLRFTVLTQ